MRGTSGLQEDFGLGASYVPRQYSPVWKTAPPDWRERLEAAISGMAASELPPIFFMADDIGAEGRAFDALCRIFRHHKVPLAMAVVPAWLSDARRERLFRSAPIDEELWGWHQHGWRHVSRQESGGKAEFGEDRPLDRQHEDILSGRRKMELIFGPHFVPIFSPPWNRFSAVTLKALRTLGFKGISAAAPLPAGTKLPWGFFNLPINIDLHTRNSVSSAKDLNELLATVGQLQSSADYAGIVIRHQQMTLFAFQFLDYLLYNLKNVLGARFFSFREILNSSDGKKTGPGLR